MAQLFQLVNVEFVIQKYNLNYFIETGTGKGETIEFVQNLNFKLIQSCEIEKSLYEESKQKFNKANIKLWNEDSTSALKLMLNEIDGPALIFLDAHFPGHNYIRKEFKSDLYSSEQILPLEKELKIISDWKHKDKSVIIVDDLRIYKDGEYEGGNWEEKDKFGYIDSSFLYHTLSESHNIIEKNIRQGALFYFPLN